MEHLTLYNFAILLGILLIVFWVDMIFPRKPRPNVSGSEYDKPIRYCVKISRPAGNQMIKALRVWRPEMTMLEAKCLIAQGRCTIGDELDVHETTALVTAIYDNAPFTCITISSTSFANTFSLIEWRAFHRG